MYVSLGIAEIGYFQKCLEFPKLLRQLQKTIKWVFWTIFIFWEMTQQR